MFTGIIETIGSVSEIAVIGSNKVFWISSVLPKELKADQSLSHNGVCLTVEEVLPDRHRVTAISETLQKTNLADWKPGDLVNLERSLQLNGRLDGHFVQGHSDSTARCVFKKELKGSWEFRFVIKEEFAPLIIEKGSIALNGVSLTIFDLSANEFSVAIIPYTYQHTNFQNIDRGSVVNIEFDIIGKYLQRFRSLDRQG